MVKATIAILLVAVGICHQEVRGCTVCAEIPGTLGSVHPKSISVALAIRKEIELGTLKSEAAAAGARGSDLRLRMMTGRHHGKFSSIELIIIDTGARFRISPEKGLVQVQPGEDLPPPEFRWVTGKDVLHALLSRRVSPQDAIGRRILVIESPLQKPANS